MRRSLSHLPGATTFNHAGSYESTTTRIHSFIHSFIISFIHSLFHYFKRKRFFNRSSFTASTALKVQQRLHTPLQSSSGFAKFFIWRRIIDAGDVLLGTARASRHGGRPVSPLYAVFAKVRKMYRHRRRAYSLRCLRAKGCL